MYTYTNCIYFAFVFTDRQNAFYDKPALLSLASLSGVFGEVTLG